MKRILILVGFVASFALGAAALSFGAARDRVADLLFGPRLMRAEVVLTDGTDYLVDKGRITALAAGSLTVTEADGRTAAVQLAPTTRVLFNGAPVGQRALRRGLQALVVHTSNGPAVVIELGRR